MKSLITLLFLAFAISAYAGDHHAHAKAIAIINPTSGSSVSGTITFTENHDGSVNVEGTIKGLSPGKHGMHIHEYGDCSDPKAMSAGGHFAGAHPTHGAQTDNVRHQGDLGNAVANEQGVATISLKDTHLKLSGGQNIIGRSLIVHEKEDDLKTQPTGNAGGRVACGVVGVSK